MAAHTELGSGESVLPTKDHDDCSDRQGGTKKQGAPRRAQVSLEFTCHDDLLLLMYNTCSLYV